MGPLRLRWVAVCPGAGAVELAKAWRKAPQCDYGLTVVNMNDCLKESVYRFTEENRQDLKALVQTAEGHCSERSDLFINHSLGAVRLIGGRGMWVAHLLGTRLLNCPPPFLD